MRAGDLVEKAADALAARPAVLDLLRWILELGYRGEKAVLGQELANRRLRMLDVGCGTGTLAGEFHPEGYVGVDLSPQFVARARRKLPRHRFLVMDVRSLGLKAESFEAALISGVLHHLDDPFVERTLREVSRVLCRGGRLLVWEDVPTRSRFNLLGHLVHWLDEGVHIRSESGYRQMLEPFFTVERSYEMRSGCCDYVLFACRKPERPS